LAPWTLPSLPIYALHGSCFLTSAQAPSACSVAVIIINYFFR
jgi:hypothetical protein